MLSRPNDARRPRWAGLLIASCVIAGGIAGCAEIDKAQPENAMKLAELRADLEQDNALVEYQKVRKEEAVRRGEDPDQYDNAEPLRAEPRFAKFWEQRRRAKYEAIEDRYKGLSADIVMNCTIRANDLVAKKGTFEDPAVVLDDCVKAAPKASFDIVKMVGISALVLVLVVAGVSLFRSARRRIDPVAQAGQKLGLGAQQTPTTTTFSGEYKSYAVKVEASAPSVGQGDGFVRAVVLSKIHPHKVVRFGPLAPPPGLDLPDLDAPEVHDPRIPEGYKLRLSQDASAEALLSGDVGFQLRAFDPVDVRVHDGMIGVTCWQVPGSEDKVIEFVDLAIAVARLYPPD